MSVSVRLLRYREDSAPLQVTPALVDPGDVPFEDAVSMVSEGFCPCPRLAHVPPVDPGEHPLDEIGVCEGCGCRWKVVSGNG